MPVPSHVNSVEEFNQCVKDFEAIHKRTYGYIMDDDVVFVNLRFTAFGIVPALEFPESDECVRETPADARKGSREMFFYDRFYESEVWDRAKLPTGSKVHGPAMIEEYASSTPVPPNHTAEIDKYHNILITRD